MKKILLTMMVALLLLGCSKDNESEKDEEPNKIDFSFDNDDVSAQYQEELLIGLTGIEPSKCNIFSSDEFILDVSNSNNKIKVIPHYAGKAFVIAEYKGVRDSCLIKIKPESDYAEEPVLELGTSRKDVRKQMSGYQGGSTIGGYTGDDYYFNVRSKVRYQFDKNDKLVAIKQELKKTSYNIERVKKGISQRYKFTSGSSTVNWYSHPNTMTVRIEEKVSEVHIWFAKDAGIMMEYYPW